MPVKILKDAVIFDRNDILFESLRDELPPYMLTTVQDTWGDDILDENPANKIPELEDINQVIQWSDINVDPSNILFHLVGTLTESLSSELFETIRNFENKFESLSQIINLDSIYGFDDDTFYLNIINTVSEMKRDKMYKAHESLESNLEYFIRIIYDNVVNSIDFKKTYFDGYTESIVFESYEDRKTSFNKLLNKLEDFFNGVLSGKKQIQVEEGFEYVVQSLVTNAVANIKEIKKIISTGILKSIIRSVINQIDDIRNGRLKLKLIVSSRPDDLLRMSVSPLYTSCQELYTGSHRKNLLANVFDTNSKIAFIVIDKPFKDCRGNEHPYIPVVRSMVRKLEDESLALDQIYKSHALEKFSIDNFIDLLNTYTSVEIEKLRGGSYEENLQGGEKVLSLPPTYSDNFNVKSKQRSVFEYYNIYGYEEASRLMEDKFGVRPYYIDEDTMLFYKQSLNNIYPFDNIKRFIDILETPQVKGGYFNENVISLLIEKEYTHVLYEIIERLYPEINESIRNKLNRPIRPDEDIEMILEYNHRFIRYIHDYIYTSFDEYETNLINTKIPDFCNKLVDLTLDKEVDKLYTIVTGMRSRSRSIYLNFGIHRESFKDVPYNMIDDEVQMVVDADINSNSLEYITEKDINKVKFPSTEDTKKIQKIAIDGIDFIILESIEKFIHDNV